MALCGPAVLLCDSVDCCCLFCFVPVLTVVVCSVSVFGVLTVVVGSVSVL